MLRARAKYHVSARANNKEFIFASRRAKDMFLQVLIEAKEHYRFLIENFCVMGNHFHLILRPGKGENLSSIMQWSLANFAIRYNKEFARTGHVWGERFFSRIINNIREYLSIYDYIDNNPTVAGLVNANSIWEYSGIAHDRLNRHDIVGRMPKIFWFILATFNKDSLRFVSR